MILNEYEKRDQKFPTSEIKGKQINEAILPTLLRFKATFIWLCCLNDGFEYETLGRFRRWKLLYKFHNH